MIIKYIVIVPSQILYQHVAICCHDKISQPASKHCWVPPRDGHDLGFLGGPRSVKHQAYLERSLRTLVGRGKNGQVLQVFAEIVCEYVCIYVIYIYIILYIIYISYIYIWYIYIIQYHILYRAKKHRHYTRLISIESETYLPCFLFKQKIQQLHYSTYLNTSLRKHLKPIPRFCSLLEKTGAKGTIGAPCVAKARGHASRFPKGDPTCVKCLWNPPPESFSVAACKEQGNYRFTSHHGYPICSMYGIFTTPS